MQRIWLPLVSFSLCVIFEASAADSRTSVKIPIKILSGSLKEKPGYLLVDLADLEEKDDPLPANLRPDIEILRTRLAKYIDRVKARGTPKLWVDVESKRVGGEETESLNISARNLLEVLNLQKEKSVILENPSYEFENKQVTGRPRAIGIDPGERDADGRGVVRLGLKLGPRDAGPLWISGKDGGDAPELRAEKFVNSLESFFRAEMKNSRGTGTEGHRFQAALKKTLRFGEKENEKRHLGPRTYLERVLPFLSKKTDQFIATTPAVADIASVLDTLMVRRRGNPGVGYLAGSYHDLLFKLADEGMERSKGVQSYLDFLAIERELVYTQPPHDAAVRPSLKERIEEAREDFGGDEIFLHAELRKRMLDLAEQSDAHRFGFTYPELGEDYIPTRQIDDLTYMSDRILASATDPKYAGLSQKMLDWVKTSLEIRGLEFDDERISKVRENIKALERKFRRLPKTITVWDDCRRLMAIAKKRLTEEY